VFAIAGIVGWHVNPELELCEHLLQVRKIDRKLMQCHNPLLDPSSSHFQRAEAEQQELRAKAKAEKVWLHRIPRHRAISEISGDVIICGSSIRPACS